MKTPLIAFLFVSALGLPAYAAEISIEAKDFFDWFATLGYPDVQDAPFAEIKTQYLNNFLGPAPNIDYGFILEHSGKSFRAIKLDLIEWEFREKNHSADVSITFELRSFTHYAKQMLAELQHPPKNGWDTFFDRLEKKTEVLLVANVCWRKGENALAQQLYEESWKMLSKQNRQRRDGRRPSVTEALEMDLGNAEFCSAMGKFSSEQVTRTQLLEKFCKIVRLYPLLADQVKAQNVVSILGRMVVEDEAHKTITVEELAKLPVTQQVEELIFQLRDQTCKCSINPGGCLLFGLGERDEGHTPAHLLAKIGYPAVPLLIKALSDDRFSRAVYFNGRAHSCPYVMTVGDCAQSVLEEIGSQYFGPPHIVGANLSTDQEIQDTVKRVQAWWDEFQKKGEKQWLIDAISLGDKYPDEFILRLRKLDSEAADKAVFAGTAKAQDDGVKARFMNQLAQIKSVTATDRLLFLMKQDKSLAIRLNAAGHLLDMDHPDALPAILQELKNIGEASHDWFDSNFETLVRLILANGKTSAMEALVRDWDRRSIRRRCKIVQTIGDFFSHDTSNLYWGFKIKPMEKEARELANKLLVHALEDTAEYDGMKGTRDFSYSSPRICDYTLRVLSFADAKTYSFSNVAKRRQRDVECITAANVWRRAHEQELLPVPQLALPKLAEDKANTITSVEIKGTGKIKGSALEQQIKELKGVPFQAATFPQLLTWFASHTTPEICGITVEAFREADLSGVELIITLDAGKYPTEGNWNTSHWREFANQEHSGVSGSCSLLAAREEKLWDEFAGGIVEGLKSPPASEFIVRAGLTLYGQ